MSCEMMDSLMLRGLDGCDSLARTLRLSSSDSVSSSSNPCSERESAKDSKVAERRCVELVSVSSIESVPSSSSSSESSNSFITRFASDSMILGACRPAVLGVNDPSMDPSAKPELNTVNHSVFSGKDTNDRGRWASH